MIIILLFILFFLLINFGKIYSSDDKNINDITLKPGEAYETTLEFKDMPGGHYEASFWVKWGENNKNTMSIYFDV